MVRALLIEPKPDIRASISEYAQTLGVDLYTASSLSDGRGLLAALKPAITIVDQELPDGDSLDLISDAANSGAHAILVSSRNEIADRVRALKFGADDYFVKPIDPEEFYLRLRKFLARRAPVPESKSVIHDFAGVK